MFFFRLPISVGAILWDVTELLIWAIIIEVLVSRLSPPKAAERRVMFMANLSLLSQVHKE